MRIRTSILICLLAATSSLQSQVIHDWENHHVLQINREPARAAFTPYNKKTGDSSITLDGTWKFHWTSTPAERILDFYKPAFDDTQWVNFPVPANWEVNGYGTPIYVSAGYPFKIDPPRVMGTPKETYTTYKERNPVGQYRRTFTLPVAWESNGQTFLRFEGVMSAFYVWINGERVGYSQGSMEPSEFNITSYLKKGTNQAAIEVYRYSDGSYLEDQDFWRFSGIHRSIHLIHTPDIRIRDFAIRTLPDKDYRDFTLQIDPQLSVYGQQTGKGYRVKAELTELHSPVTYVKTENKHIGDGAGDGEGAGEGASKSVVLKMEVDAEPILDLEHKAAVMNEWFPQRGPRKLGRMSAVVQSPKRWTAETPYLYVLNITLVDSTGQVVEQIQQRIGFRSVEVSKGQVLINGKPIRFRGVNRHEHDPRTARVMTEKLMLQDVLLMKRANINAVRTSHYPNVSRWYELCDSIGLYVMDEANIEEHGLRGTLASTPDWHAAFLDRAVRMAERDKNYPSIVMWSMGNESGYGSNFAAISAWLRDFDSTRPIHYEGAQGVNGEPDPKTVDVISRFYTRVQQDYLNPGIAEGAENERAENARWERLLSIAQRTNDDRPVMTSEYAHSMGNALGNFKEYWDEIYSHPRMLGGFIWDWCDQGIYKKLPDGRTMVAYGGDFGDQPNLKAFCFNGIVMSDREVTPKYTEVKKVYAPFLLEKEGNELIITNRNHHTGMAQYRCLWSLKIDGKGSLKGEIPLSDMAPGETARVHLPAFKLKEGTDARMMVSMVLKENTCWEKAGYEVGWEQFCLQKISKGEPSTVEMGDRQKHSNRVNELLSVSGKGFSASWDMKTGAMKSLIYKGKEMLAHQTDLPLQAATQVFRAPTDNDKSFGNWLAKDWQWNGMDTPAISTEKVTYEERPDGAILIYVHSRNQYKSGSVRTLYTYTVLANGIIDLKVDFRPEGELPELPRLGVSFCINRAYNDFTWYGCGPQDNYPDRKTSAAMGLWNGKVADQYVHYPRPQDSGNKEEVSYLSLTDMQGDGLRVEAVGKTFSASALHFTAQDLYACAHDCDLKPRAEVVLSLDAAVLGLGNSSCGPGVLKKYAIEKKPHTLHVRIAPAK